jgi:hypothetical protein
MQEKVPEAEPNRAKRRTDDSTGNRVNDDQGKYSPSKPGEGRGQPTNGDLGYLSSGGRRSRGRKGGKGSERMANSAAGTMANRTELLASLERPLACPDLNLGELEPETVTAMEQAAELVARPRGAA